MDSLLLDALSNAVSQAPLVVLLLYAIKWLDSDRKARIEKLEKEIEELRTELRQQVRAYQDYILKEG
jgi:hypothetical protein